MMPYTDIEKADLESAINNITTMKRSELVALLTRNNVPFRANASASQLRTICRNTVTHFVIQRMAAQTRLN
jgi:hypothetical protein